MSAEADLRRLVHGVLRAMQAGLRARRSDDAALRDQADAAVKAGLERLWERTERIDLRVESGRVDFEGSAALLAEDDEQGLVGALTEAGISSLTLLPGAELEELKIVLSAVAAARRSAEEDGSDLLTSLFRADLHHVEYALHETGEDGDGPSARIAPAGSEAREPPDVVRDAVRRDAASGGGAGEVVQLEKFDSTLYFLDEREIEYLKSAVDREYTEDPGLRALTVLVDILALRTETDVREETILVLEDLLPELLRTGRFEAVARLVAGVRDVSQDADSLTSTQKEALDRLRASVSDPRAIGQLYHALEAGAVAPTADSMGVLLRELRPGAVRLLLAWSDQLTVPETRAAVVTALDAFFTRWPHSLARIVGASDREAVKAGLELAARLALPDFVDVVSGLVEHGDPGIRLQVVDTLSAVGNAAAFRVLGAMTDDADPGVRTAVYKALSARTYKGALKPLRDAMSGKRMEQLDQAEKRALFEAFATTAGGEGVAVLGPMLAGKNPLGPRPSPHTRACAAVGLGIIGTPDARSALEAAQRDKDPLVRSAVASALRGER